MSGHLGDIHWIIGLFYLRTTAGLVKNLVLQQDYKFNNSEHSHHRNPKITEGRHILTHFTSRDFWVILSPPLKPDELEFIDT